jgi:hypothetical protein
LDGVFNAKDLVIFSSNPFEFPLNPLLEIKGLKQEFAIVKLFLLLDFLMILVILIFLLESELLVLINEGITLSLKLLEVFIERSIYILHSVNHHHHEDVIRRYARTNQLIDILCNTRKTLLQYLLILLLHAHTNSQLESFLLRGRQRAIALSLAGTNLID